jgi:hypothetical protein
MILCVCFTFYINNINAIKIDKDKDIVYDANYDNRGLASSIIKPYGVYYLKDVVVPFINIDSSDAAIVNNEIKDIYNTLLDSYERGLTDSYTFIEYCKYNYEKEDDVLSVILEYGISSKDITEPIKHIYNFDLSTGKLIK